MKSIREIEEDLPVGKCNMCNTENVKLCYDLVCKECHVSCSWESCITGSFNAGYFGMNGHSEKEIKAAYPNTIMRV